MAQRRTILYSGSSPHGSYRVVDTIYNGRPARLLYGDDDTPQSATTHDHKPELLFDYNQRFLEMIQSINPQKILVIGGGGFMLPTAAFQLFTNLEIDVVEIDRLLVELAYEFFNLPTDPRLNVHLGDGLEFLKRTNQRYDMIIIDAFSGRNVPLHLINSHATAQYKRHLNRSGILAINIISEYKKGQQQIAHSVIETFSNAFHHVNIFQTTPGHQKYDEQNFVITASKYAPQLDYLQSEALTIL